MEENKFKVRNKGLFLILSCFSIGGLVGSFAYPLQKFEIWRQTEPSVFSKEYTKTFVMSEVDQTTPYGLNTTKAEKIASIYNDAKSQKLILLVIGVMSASCAAIIGEDTVEDATLEREVNQINLEAKKEVLINKIKHKWAMASEAQKQLYKEEYKALVDLFGDETQQASELNQTDKFINAYYMLQEGHSIDTVVAQTWNVSQGSADFERLKQAFQQWLEEEK